jgi:hypothetical protein
MDESDLAEAAVKAVVSETVKGGAGALFGWLTGKLTWPSGQEAIAKTEAKPDAPSAQLALKAQVMSLLEEDAAFKDELRVRLGQTTPASTTIYAAQTASGVSGAVHQIQGNRNPIGDQSGGVEISGSVGSVGGDIVGRDKIIGAPSAAAVEDALRPLIEVIKVAPAEKRPETEAKLAKLKQEVAKGKNADDGVLARLVDGLVALVPAATSAVVSVFATPILGAVAGPVTKFVLDKLRGR